MISESFSNYAGTRFALDRHARRSNGQAGLFSGLALLAGHALLITCMIPVAAIQFIAGIRVTPADPPASTPYRGHHPRTGVPLRSFQDSLDDLDN